MILNIEKSHNNNKIHNINNSRSNKKYTSTNKTHNYNLIHNIRSRNNNLRKPQLLINKSKLAPLTRHPLTPQGRKHINRGKNRTEHRVLKYEITPFYLDHMEGYTAAQFSTLNQNAPRTNLAPI